MTSEEIEYYQELMADVRRSVSDDGEDLYRGLLGICNVLDALLHDKQIEAAGKTP
jgi:hypothetical protein